MIEDIVDRWLENLADLKKDNLLTAQYGLTRPGRVRVKSDRDFVVPVLLNAPEVTDVKTLEDGLLLNHKQRSVLFVEATGTKVSKNGNQELHTLPVRVVVWFNKDAFDSADGNVSAKFVTAVVTALKKPVKLTPGVDMVQGLSFQMTGIVPGWQVFQKYTFREETGYLFSPYQSAGIDGNLTFYLNENSRCQSPLQPSIIGGHC